MEGCWFCILDEFNSIVEEVYIDNLIMDYEVIIGCNKCI